MHIIEDDHCLHFLQNNYTNHSPAEFLSFVFSRTQNEITICAYCLVRCRKTAADIICKSNRTIDGLCEWFCTQRMCSDQDKDGEKETEKHLKTLLELFLNHLTDCDDKVIDKSSHRILALGSPLFLYRFNSSHTKGNLYSR